MLNLGFLATCVLTFIIQQATVLSNLESQDELLAELEAATDEVKATEEHAA